MAKHLIKIRKYRIFLNYLKIDLTPFDVFEKVV